MDLPIERSLFSNIKVTKITNENSTVHILAMRLGNMKNLGPEILKRV